jgi:hypothetical protein
MYQLTKHQPHHVPWNKGKLVGQKLPLKLQEIWAVRIHLEIRGQHRNLALFNLAIDSKLRACDSPGSIRDYIQNQGSDFSMDSTRRSWE